MALRVANDWDWYIFTGLSVPTNWVGMVIEEPTHISHLGAIYLGKCGRWWVTYGKAPGKRWAKSTVEASGYLLQWSDIQHLSLHAVPDESNPRARAFMKHFGFAPTTEKLAGGHIWVRP